MLKSVFVWTKYEEILNSTDDFLKLNFMLNIFLEFLSVR